MFSSCCQKPFPNWAVSSMALYKIRKETGNDALGRPGEASDKVGSPIGQSMSRIGKAVAFLGGRGFRFGIRTEGKCGTPCPKRDKYGKSTMLAQRTNCPIEYLI